MVVAQACTPPCGMMALLFEFPVLRPKVDKFATIDLHKRKGPSSYPNIDGPKELLTQQKRHSPPRPDIP